LKMLGRFEKISTLASQKNILDILIIIKKRFLHAIQQLNN
jgi:hypothetical protein